MRNASIAAAALVVLGLLLVEPVSAQSSPTQIVLGWEEPSDANGRVMPLAELVVVPLTVELHLGHQPAACLGNYHLFVEVKSKPPYSSALVTPPASSGSVGTIVGPVYTGSSSEQVRSYPVKVLLAVNREAPAFESGIYEVAATLAFPTTTNGCTFSGGRQVGSVSVLNDFLPDMQVEPTSLGGAGMRGQIPITITNTGNGPLRVSATVSVDDEDAFDKLDAAEVRVESPLNGARPATSTMILRWAAARAGVFSVDMRLVGSYDGAADDLTVVEELLTFVIDSSADTHASQYDDPLDLPSLAALGALGALGAATWLRRRRA